MSTIHDGLARLVRDVVAKEHTAIERACEIALQGGEDGVLVVRGLDGHLVEVSVDPSVPYGTIHERTQP